MEEDTNKKCYLCILLPTILPRITTMFGLSETVINKIRDVFKKHPNIEEVIIIGSRAKGDYSQSADVELAIKGTHVSFNQLMAINDQIEELELLYKVDVVIYRERKGTTVTECFKKEGKEFYKREEIEASK